MEINEYQSRYFLRDFEILSFLLGGRTHKSDPCFAVLLLLLGPFLDLSGNGTRINQRIVGNYIEYDQIYRHLLLWITQVL